MSQFADGQSGRQMSPEDCARLGLPAGSVVLEGASGPPRQQQQQQPQQQQQQQQQVQYQQQTIQQPNIPRASIGASFTKRGNGFYCDAVTPGSSAAASGLQVNMMLEKIDRQKVASWNPAQLAGRLLGKEGSMVQVRYRDARNQICRKHIVRDCYAEEAPQQAPPQQQIQYAPQPPQQPQYATQTVQYVQQPQVQYMPQPQPQPQPQVQYVQQQEYVQQQPVQYVQQQQAPVEYVQYEQPMQMRGGYHPMEYAPEYMQAPAYGAPQYAPGPAYPVGGPGYGGGGGGFYAASPPRGYGGPPPGGRYESDFGDY